MVDNRVILKVILLLSLIIFHLTLPQASLNYQMDLANFPPVETDYCGFRVGCLLHGEQY
jgi:hypothetical protein